MKYIELYLNQRKEELENLKKEEIDRFEKEYQNCQDDIDIENLMGNTAYNYYLTVDSYNMRLQEIENLRNDLIPKENLESKGE